MLALRVDAFEPIAGAVALRLLADDQERQARLERGGRREHAPDAKLIAGPELGAVALAAAASLESGLPFLIVRKEAKDYGTSTASRGLRGGDRVCVVEDVVTSGGAAVEAVKALREAGLECSTAICVVDREEGGVDALARHAVRLWPIFRAQRCWKRTTAAKPHG